MVKNPKEPVTGRWTETEAENHEEIIKRSIHGARELGLSPGLLEEMSPIWLLVGTNQKDNLHQNGNPICVQAYQLEIKRNE